MALQPGVALVEDAEQHVAALAARRRAPSILLVVHPAVDDAERFGDAVGLLRERDGAVRGSDLEAVALLLERHRSGCREGIAALRADACQDAELVAADAIDLALPATAPLSFSAILARSASPAGWPNVSLYALNPSRSSSIRTDVVRASSVAPRSIISLRRFPTPVSASVSASMRVFASSCIFSRNVYAIRATTASIEVAARTTAGVFSGSNCP